MGQHEWFSVYAKTEVSDYGYCFEVSALDVGSAVKLALAHEDWPRDTVIIEASEVTDEDGQPEDMKDEEGVFGVHC